LSSVDVRVRCDVEGIEFILRQVGERAVKGVTAVLRQEAQEIERLARSFAPVDDGYLESAITATRVDSEADSRGRATRSFWRVWVDLEKAAPGDEKNPSKVVGDYFVAMHELLMPYGNGPYNLGPKSQAKDGGSGVVGGKFMERAFADREKQIYKRAFWEIQKAAGRI
jgi:hypothetical protein